MAKTRSHSHKKRHHKRKHKVHGGDASTWATQVVGDYPHSAAPGSNLIQQNNPAINQSGGVGGADILSPGTAAYAPIVGAPPAYNVVATTPGAAPMKGGNQKIGHGGNVVSELAVPAVLLVANQAFGKKTGKRYPRSNRRFRKRRFSRRRR